MPLRCCHPNILQLLGFCVESGLHSLIYPYMENGSLLDRLQVSNKHAFLRTTFIKRKHFYQLNQHEKDYGSYMPTNNIWKTWDCSLRLMWGCRDRGKDALAVSLAVRANEKSVTPKSEASIALFSSENLFP